MHSCSSIVTAICEACPAGEQPQFETQYSCATSYSYWLLAATSMTLIHEAERCSCLGQAAHAGSGHSCSSSSRRVPSCWQACDICNSTASVSSNPALGTAASFDSSRTTCCSIFLHNKGSAAAPVACPVSHAKRVRLQQQLLGLCRRICHLM
jgi:hypothetical protein